MEILYNFSSIYCFITFILGAMFMFTTFCIAAMRKKQEPKNEVHFYVARDKNGKLWLYMGKPIRGDDIFYIDISKGSMGITCHKFKLFGLNEKDYANLEWEDEPVEVFLNLED